ncbi:MAG: hypothetical protein ACOYK8_07735 [Alphaproteobacteria bacterium]
MKFLRGNKILPVIMVVSIFIPLAAGAQESLACRTSTESLEGFLDSSLGKSCRFKSDCELIDINPQPCGSHYLYGNRRSSYSKIKKQAEELKEQVKKDCGYKDFSITMGCEFKKQEYDCVHNICTLL